jgi:dATP pyrophosphohydrolase
MTDTDTQTSASASSATPHGQLPLRCSAVACAVINGRQILLLKRAKGAFRGQWTLVSGRIEAGEKAWQAAVREVREETGLKPITIYTSGTTDLFYNPAEEVMEMVPVFVVRVAAQDPVTLDDAHEDHAWLPLPRAIDSVAFPGQRRALESIAHFFMEKTPEDFYRIDDFRP